MNLIKKIVSKSGNITTHITLNGKSYVSTYYRTSKVLFMSLQDFSFSSQTDCNEQYRRCFPSHCDISVKYNSTDVYKFTTSSDVYLKYCTTEERTKVKFHLLEIRFSYKKILMINMHL